MYLDGLAGLYSTSGACGVRQAGGRLEMSVRTSIITAGALLALVAPVAASGAAAKASRAVAVHKTIHAVGVKKPPVASVGPAAVQPLTDCTTMLVEGYLLTTTCTIGGKPDIGPGTASPAPATAPASAPAPVPLVAPAANPSTAQEPAWEQTNCTTETLDGYLLITDC
jgi:hypothetical protein